MLTAPKLVGRDTEVQSRRLGSLRTTDEAPVRRIRQLLHDGPVTGLDIGCETGGTRSQQASRRPHADHPVSRH